MSVTPIERIRQAVVEQLSRLSGESLPEPYESILIRNGLYCGRKFLWQGYEVIWFLEEDQIKFFGPCGNLLYSSPIIPFMHAVENNVSQAVEECSPAQIDRFAA